MVEDTLQTIDLPSSHSFDSCQPWLQVLVLASPRVYRYNPILHAKPNDAAGPGPAGIGHGR